MNIAVIGMGKIGLPLAVQFARKGEDVVGVDVDAARVNTINLGNEPFPGEADLADFLGGTVRSGRLRATTEYADAVPGADIVVVVVPLFVGKDDAPDFGWMDNATEAIASTLSTGTVVLYETTLPVGTTRTRWKPILEKGSGLTEGRDFHVAFSPERVLTGRVFADLRKYPKLVGGLSDEGAQRAIDFYTTVLDFDDRPDLAQPNGVWNLGSPEAAEMAKLAETTYRDVNIGLANQFAKFAESAGIDVYSVIEAANSQPYSHIHRPGIAVGGHCIPVYPRLYLWNDPDADIVGAGRRANNSMPDHAVERLRAAYGDLSGASVVILGASYRGGVKETAFSGVFPLVEALTKAGASPLVHDPLFTPEELRDLGLVPYDSSDQVDAVIVQADHPEYRSIGTEDFPSARVVIDGRAFLDASRWDPPGLIVLGTPP